MLTYTNTIIDRHRGAQIVIDLAHRHPFWVALGGLILLCLCSPAAGEWIP